MNHWIQRPVWVLEPSRSKGPAAGRRKTSVFTFLGSTSGSETVCQMAADSVSWKSWTTSRSRFRIAFRSNAALGPPTAGFWPMSQSPFTIPWLTLWKIETWSYRSSIRPALWGSPSILGRYAYAKSFPGVAASPQNAFSMLTKYAGACFHQLTDLSRPSSGWISAGV